MNDRSTNCPGESEIFYSVSVQPQSTFFFHEQDPFLPTSYTQPWGLSTPGSCTFWAFEPGPSAPTPWWSSFSPYQTKARTTSEAWACLVDWTEAWTASVMKRWERNRGAVKHWWEMRGGGGAGALKTSPERKKRTHLITFYVMEIIRLIMTTWPKLRKILVLHPQHSRNCTN